jgi:glycosyltransferase involved in cell wall biosynthesis
MKRVLISAFACQPNKGSEYCNGWNWPMRLANLGFEVHVLTLRSHQPFIETVEVPSNLHFHYIQLPFRLQAMHKLSQATMYLHYILWQGLAYKRAKALHKKLKFDVVHHVSWGNVQMGSFLYKLNAPFIIGPAGGGQKAPEAFKEYFKWGWAAEVKRERVADWLIKNNPACKKMLRSAHSVIAANKDTLELVKSIGAKNYSIAFDHAVPDEFFPEQFTPKAPSPGKLNMLWVGRFMPRKGLLMTLDVMARLKNYPNIMLTVLGDGEMKEEVVKKIKENNLGETVKLRGMVPQEEVNACYATHDIFFFNSLRDSGPSQVIDAMAYGLPVVTINIHGQGSIVSDQTGIRCKCDTPEIAVEELEKAILYLYNNPHRVTEMSKAAYEFAKKQTWSSRIQTLVKDHYPV